MSSICILPTPRNWRQGDAYPRDGSSSDGPPQGLRDDIRKTLIRHAEWMRCTGSRRSGVRPSVASLERVARTTSHSLQTGTRLACELLETVAELIRSIAHQTEIRVMLKA